MTSGYTQFQASRYWKEVKSLKQTDLPYILEIEAERAGTLQVLLRSERRIYQVIITCSPPGKNHSGWPYVPPLVDVVDSLLVDDSVQMNMFRCSVIGEDWSPGLFFELLIVDVYRVICEVEVAKARLDRSEGEFEEKSE